MGVINDLRTGWEKGRSIKRWREGNDAAIREYWESKNMLDSELDEDNRRDNRIYNATIGKSWDDHALLNKPNDEPTLAKVIGDLAGEILPRKKTITRRRVVRRKTMSKKCKCKVR